LALSGIWRRSGFRAVWDLAPFGIPRRSALRRFSSSPFARRASRSGVLCVHATTFQQVEHDLT